MKQVITFGLVLTVCLQSVFADVNSDAFSAFKKQKFPLTPNQIHEYKGLVDSEQKALASPAKESPPLSSSSIIPVSLSPGMVQPLVRISKGMITSIVMTDKTGTVWPIASYSLGDKKSFNVTWDKKGGVLMIQGLKDYGQANIGILLKGLDVPVMLSLVLGQKKWDFLDYIRVQAYQSKAQAYASKEHHAPDFLIKLLNGVELPGAIPLDISGASAQVWSYHGKYLLLTRGTLISPQWSAKQSGTGPNSLNAYELPAAPSILISIDGKLKQVTVMGS